MTNGPEPWEPGSGPVSAGQPDLRRHAPATERNRDAIVAILRDALPASGLVLEVASGSGEHAVHFAGAFPDLDWQPSDPDPAALASIAAWRANAALSNLRQPIRLDAADDWPIAHADAILCINMQSNSCEGATSAGYAACLCINMVHISEWAATVGLFRGCANLLPSGAPLILYGPYIESDVETAPSNLAFDRSLKERNSEWGLRDVADVDRVAADFGFERTRRVEMPANNLTLIYRSR
ncbi:DUF938 domain-containing protein [Sphingobium sp.]|uniref:DUF938 domain-containing protein n=1 Tax=Sphingobium sp. TaxID=1912891 RepID=UPI002BB34010|nr:DUF938 domain-containing protein [Sphingobium sp.]HUD94121.1 DUF938 domain-containing protein [Sphingobium sp.]